MPPNYPDQFNRDPNESQQYHGSVFRVGNPELTQETLEGNKRILKWVPTELDARMSDIAGWDALQNGIDDDGFGYIELPPGTRSASTILSGLEAWEGEKAEILHFVSDYEKKVYKKYGSFDTTIALDYVGVTKDRKLFVVPPHGLENGPQERSSWRTHFFHDLDQVLGVDPKRFELIQDFFREIDSIASQRESR